MNTKCYGAIDLGASSGRLVIGYLDENKKISLEEIHRFDNIQKKSNGHDCWDLEMLFQNIIIALKKCPEKGFIPKTIGIDTWGVDFVSLDQNGEIIGDSVAYRDARTDGIMDKEIPMSFDEIYKNAGIQKLAFNSLYQFVALKKQNPDIYKNTNKFLMIPEYLMYKLTGKMVAEYTNCSTTSMLNANTCNWDEEIFEKFNLDKDKFLKPEMPGKVIGKLSSEIEKEIGYQTKLVLVATHDTGSAYISIPSENKNSCALSSGTWSLLGCENEIPITNKKARMANFTNEGGYNKKYRFLKNIMGLWIIQSVRRELNLVDYVEVEKTKDKHAKFNDLKNKLIDAEEKTYSFPDLIDAAKDSADYKYIIDVNENRFLSPKSMISEIQEACKELNYPMPDTIGKLMSCIYVSLATCYKNEIKKLSDITQKNLNSLNIVGGGCQDTYLNQITADICNIKVFAGPIEGTSIGNIGVQLISDNVVDDLASLRKLIKDSFEIKEYLPHA